MGESMSLAATGGSQYRCTRGNCDAVLPGPHAQDAHNAAAHGAARSADPFAGIPNADDSENERM